MRRKRKEAEREGEASAVMVSQSALPAPSPFKGAFCGREQGFTVVDILKKKKRGREAAEEIWRMSFLQRERLPDAHRFVYSPLEV